MAAGNSKTSSEEMDGRWSDNGMKECCDWSSQIRKVNFGGMTRRSGVLVQDWKDRQDGACALAKLNWTRKTVHVRWLGLIGRKMLCMAAGEE